MTCKYYEVKRKWKIKKIRRCLCDGGKYITPMIDDVTERIFADWGISVDSECPFEFMCKFKEEIE